MSAQSKISTFFQKCEKRPVEKAGSHSKCLRLMQDASESEKEWSIDPQQQFNESSLLLSQSGRLPTTECDVGVHAPSTKKTCCNPLVCHIGTSWAKALRPEFTKPYFLKLSDFVSAERARGSVYPPINQVFLWTHMCSIKDTVSEVLCRREMHELVLNIDGLFFPQSLEFSAVFKEIKVVILGQDPYHGPNQAHGLSFSVQRGISPPPSLGNIFKELSNDIDGFKHPGHGNLSGLAKQGVLLLNACLTVREHQANSHAGKGWEQFTDATIHWLNTNLSGLVFMLWGAYAQKKGTCIDMKKHHLLKTVHPSPLSAHRGFLGCRHFSKCNSLLKLEGKRPIDWTRLPLD